MTPTEPVAASPSTIQRLRLYYARHEGRVAAVFFAAGFVFDTLAVGRVDSWHMIAQQAVYLAIVTTVLTQMFFVPEEPAPEGLSSIRRHYYRHRLAILSFFLGTLLNVYTLFFFKSSSLLVSFWFMLVMIALLFLNEFGPFKRLGLAFKFALLSLCGLSFCATVVPVIFGRVGTTVFLASMTVGCLPMLGLAAWIRERAPARFAAVRSELLVPFGLMLVVFLAAYLLRVIPPVPLSLPFIGVYHAVERTPQGYLLGHERPLWAFWRNGDQHFRAQPGDRVYVFFRVFSPASFADEVSMRWFHYEPHGWALQDAIPIKIVGGRAEGFRGYGFKSKYQPGAWKVQIETTDGREIGRVYFDLVAVPPLARTFAVETH
jgi:Protein of unknown function (DUF2914)